MYAGSSLKTPILFSGEMVETVNHSLGIGDVKQTAIDRDLVDAARHFLHRINKPITVGILLLKLPNRFGAWIGPREVAGGRNTRLFTLRINGSFGVSFVKDKFRTNVSRTANMNTRKSPRSAAVFRVLPRCDVIQPAIKGRSIKEIVPSPSTYGLPNGLFGVAIKLPD